MSRILKTGDNQVTQSYTSHVAKVMAGKAWAKGIDVVKKPSQTDSIVAHTAGKVIKVMTGQSNGSTDSEGMGYGNYVMIQHSSNYVTLYAHMAIVDVKDGQTVSKGEVIGTMGNTGNSTGAHLHFEVRKYKSTPTANLHDTSRFEWQDPTIYIDADLPAQIVSTPAKTYYRVQVGAYEVKSNAVRQAKELIAKGYPCIIKKFGKYYRVQVGAFEVRANADKQLTKIKAAGYKAAYVTTEGGDDVAF